MALCKDYIDDETIMFKIYQYCQNISILSRNHTRQLFPYVSPLTAKLMTILFSLFNNCYLERNMYFNTNFLKLVGLKLNKYIAIFQTPKVAGRGRETHVGENLNEI